MTGTPEAPVTVEQRPVPVRGVFLPLMLITAGFLIWMGLQAFQLFTDREALLTALSQQDKPLATAQKVRVAADSLVTKTLALANQGNPNAQQVVDALRQRGIAINPNSTPPAPVP
jgi:hypothetical protein